MILVAAALKFWLGDLIDARYGVPSRTQHPVANHLNKQQECGCREKRNEPRDKGIPDKQAFRHSSVPPLGVHDIQCCATNAGDRLLLKFRSGHFVIVQGLPYHRDIGTAQCEHVRFSFDAIRERRRGVRLTVHA